MELTILMPCLNEALTVKDCVLQAMAYLAKRDITGEILVADNGSNDGSQILAREAGARVIEVATKGYGAALMGGIKASRGRFVIMGDADKSYDFGDLDPFVEELRAGHDLVIGNRFKGGISPGAMPFLNRYVGNPLLSFIGRTLYCSDVGDFHCGIRGFNREAIMALRLRARGMEFASEMIVKASLAQLSIVEVPTTLRPDGRLGTSHLRPWRDGWRHLRFMLLRSPNWVFLYPGAALTLVGLAFTARLMFKPIFIPGYFTLDINSLLYFAIASVLGVQIYFFGMFALVLAQKMELRIATGLVQKALRLWPLKGALVLGVLIMLTGMAGAIFAVVQWGQTSFGALVPTQMMRITIPSVALIAIGMQVIFGTLLLSFIEIE